MTALVVQLTRRRYIPEVYWFAVAMVAVFGTMAADVVHVVAGVPYAATAVMYAVLLGAVFFTWWRVERTLSVHDVTTLRREAFYWAAVVGTFALGTALGDFTAVALGWGYLPSIAVYAAMMLVPVLSYRFFGLNGVVAFWVAYVLTRPLGASVADWLGKPRSEGGLGAGAGWVALAFAVVFVGLVVVARFRRAAGPPLLGAPQALRP